MHKPIALIIANVVHDVAAEVVRAEKRGGTPVPGEDIANAVARRALCQIGYEAAIGEVVKALAMIGAVESLDEALARVAAAREQAGEARRDEAGGETTGQA